MRGIAGVICWACCLILPGLAHAQASAILLDANPAPGYQAAAALEPAQPGQRVAVEIFGRHIEGASGFSAQIAFDNDRLAFDGFVAAEGAIPGFTGLKLGGEGGVVEIGGASVAGTASGPHGHLGVVHFRVREGFSGTASISLGPAVVFVDGETRESQAVTQVVVGAAPGPPVALDADLTGGYQAAHAVLDVKAGDRLGIEVYGRDVAGASGFSARLRYDASKLIFRGFSEAGLITGLTGLILQPELGVVEIGGASVSGIAGISAGRLGLVQFEVLPGFYGDTDIQLVQGRLSLEGQAQAFQSDTAIRVSGLAREPEEKTADFTGDGRVDFADFLLFAQGFGKRLGDAGFDVRLDLDGSGGVDFADFLLFAQAFGR